MIEYLMQTYLPCMEFHIEYGVHKVRKKSMSLFDRATCRVEKYLVNNTRCKRFLPVSNLTKGKFLREYRMKTEKIRVIHPGVDIDRFQELDKRHCRKKIRNPFSTDSSNIMILLIFHEFRDQRARLCYGCSLERKGRALNNSWDLVREKWRL